jgi:hypothetical protein
LLPAVETITSASAYNSLTGLYRFTLSDCGSIAPLPTLNLDILQKWNCLTIMLKKLWLMQERLKISFPLLK